MNLSWAAADRLLPSGVLPLLPARPSASHKGSFGEVVVVGGHPTMPGAPAFSALGALRAGAGLVRIAAPADVLVQCLALVPSAIGLALPDRAVTDLAARIDAGAVIAAGPGLGQGRAQRGWIAALLGGPHRLVLDADGLNLLARLDPSLLPRAAPLVLTPHPGEARRLAQAFALSADPLAPERRAEFATTLACRAGAVVVLKGQRTVIADGTRVAHNATGDAALAIPGSGDVLTGVIAALMAQGLPAWEAAVLGAHLHGAAGDRWSATHGPSGLTAGDLAALLPAAARTLPRAD